MRTIDEIMRTAPVIPVLVIEDAGQARALAEALVTGGLTVLEVTLRTPAALEAIREMKQVPGAIVVANRTGVPFLPGVATATEIMHGLDLGLDHFKFFPAEASGGLPALKALAAPFGQVRFCPTGGISAERAGEWLAHPSVLCVGGSWIVPKGADMAEVNALARQAATLAR